MCAGGISSDGIGLIVGVAMKPMTLSTTMRHEVYWRFDRFPSFVAYLNHYVKSGMQEADVRNVITGALGKLSNVDPQDKLMIVQDYMGIWLDNYITFKEWILTSKGEEVYNRAIIKYNRKVWSLKNLMYMISSYCLVGMDELIEHIHGAQGIKLSNFDFNKKGVDDTDGQ
jgi:hypothetical protein